jgi:cobalt-zinc-cadmium efflux system outer membrane protein
MKHLVSTFLAVLVWAPSFGSAAEPLDLAALLAEAERANPDLLARIARAEAAAEVPEQRGALPDPVLSGSYTNDGITSFTLGSSQFSNVTARWDQMLPARSVRSADAAAARAEADVVRVSAETLKATLRARVIALYGAIWRADRTRELLNDGREWLGTARDAARARYEAGDGSAERVLRADNEIRRLELDLVSVSRERRAAEIALGSVLGRSSDCRFGPAGELPGEILPAAADDAEQAAAGAPRVAEARAEEARATAATENARAQERPEWGFMAAYQYLGGLDPMVMGGFTVRLPLWKDRKQARAVASAEREAEAAGRDRESAEVQARAAVRDLLSEIDALGSQLALYERTIVPQDVATIDAARAAASAGRGELTLVIDDIVRLLADRRAAVDLKSRKLTALAALEAASGTTRLALAGSGESQ